jgi:hypothetical protein
MFPLQGFIPIIRNLRLIEIRLVGDLRPTLSFGQV